MTLPKSETSSATFLSASAELKNLTPKETTIDATETYVTEKPVSTEYKVTSKDADSTLKFLEMYDAEVPEITPSEERKLKWKVCSIILFITTVTEFIMFADKFALSYAAITDLFEDTGMTQNTYNNSSTLFYVGYLVGQVNLIFVQKFSIRYCMIAITFGWSLLIFLTCTAHNYQGIYATRLFLGFVESVAISALNTTMGQFFTKEEKAASAAIFAIAVLGVTIPMGLIAYGIMHAAVSIPIWKLYFIVVGCMSFVWFIFTVLFYPSNPTDAKFLSLKEKVWVIRRVQKSTGASIEQRVIKKHQIYETLRDPISWLFFCFFLFQMLANNLHYQQNLLFTGMGNVTQLDSTLVSVAGGGFAVVCSLCTSVIMFYYSNLTALFVIFWSLPCFGGSIAAATIPWENKIALTGMVTMVSSLYGIPWMLMISWSASTCSGYTKVLTRNGLIMFGYAVANLIAPQLWQESDAPRFIPAWIVQIVLSFGIAPSLAGVIWIILKRRNTKRQENINSASDSGEVILEDGQVLKTNLGALDLTDLENEHFIYPL